MKTRNTLICWPAEWNRKKMAEEEIDDLVKDRTEHIRATFKWENYPDWMAHLVVAVWYDGDQCVLYPNGYLMSDREFDEKIAYRKDLKIERVLAYHKGTAKF